MARRGKIGRGESEAFAAFWTAYPARRPNPRAIAGAAFARAVRAGAHPADLIRAARLYAAECREKKRDNDYILHARTFLTQRRWLDYLDRVPAPAPEAMVIDHPLWEALRARVPASDFRAWILPCAIMERSPERLVLRAPGPFQARHVAHHYGETIRAALGLDALEIRP